ncbi:MAG TPA: PAS domain S-box protein [Gaiellales bacterium]|nr:PAS domain S-box protein [Gaiellales bacterium]
MRSDAGRRARLIGSPGLRALTFAAGAVLTVMVVDAELTTHVHHSTAGYLILGLGVAWSFLLAGLLAWVRRPANRIGPLMCGVGLTWLCSGLSDSPHEVLLTFSLLVSSLWLGMLVHLLLAYPTGRLGTLDARLVTAAVYIDTWVISLIAIPFTEPAKDGSDARSAHNLLLVEHSHETVTVLDSISLGIGIALIVAILVILGRRWRAASPALRRTLAPVYLTGGLSVIMIGVVAFFFTVVESGSSDVPFYLFSLTFAAVPQSFVYGLLRSQFGRSSAVRALIAQVESSDQPARLRDALRDALGDPSLELVYELPDGSACTNADGEPVARPEPEAGRAVTPIQTGTLGSVLMVHDESLLDDPGLMEAVTAAAALALRNQSLTGELTTRLRELRASQERLNELLENVRLIAVSLDTEGRISYANPFLCELTGWERDELIGRDWLETFGGTKVRFLERMAADDVLPYEENWIRTRTGDVRDIAWNNTVLRDRDGHIIGATSIGEDITLRRRNERRMGFQLTVARALANAERLEDVAEPLVEAVGSAFDCWACVYWKAEPDELVPVAVWARRGVVSDGFVERIKETRLLDDTGLAWYVRDRRKAHWDLDVADDPVVVANARASTAGSFAFPIIAAGEVDAVVQMCADDPVGPDPEMLALMEAVADRIGQLIERRRAEAAVAQSEARKSATLASALDCIVTIDANDRIVEFNPAAERTFGRVAHDVIGQDMPQVLIPPRYREDHRRGLAQHKHTGSGRLIGAHVELAGMRADGSEFPIELTVTRIQGDDGQPLFTAFIRDITDRKHAEEELRQSRARIVTAGDEARRRLERNLHDGAQQRLVSLSLSLRLARSQFQKDPSAADVILEAAGEELAHALEELRELARGIHPAILTDRGLQPALEALANRSSLPVELTEVPEQPLPAPVEAAAYYVVAESLTNVAKYANAKRATVRIMQDNGSAVIEVEDDGVGGANAAAGSGLRGLADRVEALDGELTVESPPGHGTRVRAVIPCG